MLWSHFHLLSTRLEVDDRDEEVEEIELSLYSKVRCSRTESTLPIFFDPPLLISSHAGRYKSQCGHGFLQVCKICIICCYGRRAFSWRLESGLLLLLLLRLMLIPLNHHLRTPSKSQSRPQHRRLPINPVIDDVEIIRPRKTMFVNQM